MTKLTEIEMSFEYISKIKQTQDLSFLLLKYNEPEVGESKF